MWYYAVVNTQQRKITNKKANKIRISGIKFEKDIPLSYQLKMHLLNLIRAGRLQTGDRLPTVYELALQTGVSSATTRKVIAELTREGYLSSMPALGTFVIDRNTRQNEEISHPERSIGILFPQMTEDLFNPEKSPWTWEILSAIQETLSSHNYFCTFFPMAGSLDKAKKIVLNNSGHFSGFISFPDYSGGAFLEILEASKKPYLTIGKWKADMEHNYVSCDDTGLGRSAAVHLAETGCSSFLAVYSPSRAYYPAIREVMGFQEELLRLGIEMSRIKVREKTAPAEILKGITDIKPCGIFVAGEKLAVDILNFCREQGKKIPAEIRIVSDAGTKICEYSHPPLTAVCQPMRDIGRESALTLIKLAENNVRYTKGIELSGKLVVRGSTKESKKTSEVVTKS